MSSSLFDKYGGFGTVSKIVREFYRSVLASPRLTGYFTGVDMERLIDHQTKFIAHAMGGPADYTGRDLDVAHRRLRVKPEDFDEVATILEEVLEEAGMERGDITAVLGVVASARSHVVSAA